MTRRPLCAAAVVVLGLCPLVAWSFELQPISREFAPRGSGAVQSYEVVNSGADPIAISVGVLTRSIDAAGVETNQSAEDDFLVYPPQFIVDAGKRQTVRVSWLGNPVIPQELGYRLLVEQLPIERFLPPPADGPRSGRVFVLTRYKGSLYVKPAHARPELKVESAQLETDPAGKPVLAVNVHNQGTGRALLKESKFQVKGRGGQSATVSVAGLELPSTVVLPGGQRRLVFPWPEGFPREEVVVSPLP